MSGPMFSRPYGLHNGHVIKMADETRNASPVAITDDAELFKPLRPSTIYTMRIVVHHSGNIASSVWYPACTNAVDFCAAMFHRPVGDNATERIFTALSGDHIGNLYDTTRFNANTPFPLSAQGAKELVGVIQTGSSGGVFSIKWGGGNGSRTMLKGSFMYLHEAQAY